MSVLFDATRGLVVVPAEVEGPTRRAFLNLALDTGATDTIISASALLGVGYDLAAQADRFQVTTGSRVEYAVRVAVRQLKALGRDCRDLSVLAFSLPPATGVDGLIGLDFLRGLTLTVDFRRGQITLA